MDKTQLFEKAKSLVKAISIEKRLKMVDNHQIVECWSTKNIEHLGKATVDCDIAIDVRN